LLLLAVVVFGDWASFQTSNESALDGGKETARVESFVLGGSIDSCQLGHDTSASGVTASIVGQIVDIAMKTRPTIVGRIEASKFVHGNAIRRTEQYPNQEQILNGHGSSLSGQALELDLGYFS
jgi:hypothetical protein